MSIEIETETKIPKRIFIVPYRNRVHHKFFFSRQMDFILEGETDYEIYFSHQCDRRQFNRGATRNIGFLAMRKKYPEHYQDITFIFNDVDTLPFHKIFDYYTIPGIVKHYYGFRYALGGIVVINGGDFEKINGYPNYWGWGNEDSALQTRCLNHGLKIDRSTFYEIGSPEMLQLFDGVSRLVSPQEYHKGKNDNGLDGLTSINRLTFSVDIESLNDADNKYTTENPKRKYINILSFITSTDPNQHSFHEYDLRKSPSEIIQPKNDKTDKKMISVDDWKVFENIPIPSKQTTRPKTAFRPAPQVQRIPNPPRVISNMAYNPQLVPRKNRHYSKKSY